MQPQTDDSYYDHRRAIAASKDAYLNEGPEYGPRVQYSMLAWNGKVPNIEFDWETYWLNGGTQQNYYDW